MGLSKRVYTASISKQETRRGVMPDYKLVEVAVDPLEGRETPRVLQFVPTCENPAPLQAGDILEVVPLVSAGASCGGISGA